MAHKGNYIFQSWVVVKSASCSWCLQPQRDKSHSVLRSCVSIQCSVPLLTNTLPYVATNDLTVLTELPSCDTEVTNSSTFLTSRWCRQTIMKITDTQGTEFFKMVLPSSSPVQNCFIQLILINNHLLLHALPFQRLFKINLVWGRESKRGRGIFPSIGHLMGYIMRSEQSGNSTPLELRSG